MKNLLKNIRGIKNRIKKGQATNEEALELLSNSLDQFNEHNSKSLELEAYHQEIRRLKKLKDKYIEIEEDVLFQKKRTKIILNSKYS